MISQIAHKYILKILFVRLDKKCRQTMFVYLCFSSIHVLVLKRIYLAHPVCFSYYLFLGQI